LITIRFPALLNGIIKSVLSFSRKKSILTLPAGKKGAVVLFPPPAKTGKEKKMDK
jgi:hypothetical protein